MLEAQSSDDAKTQADKYSHEDFENEIEDSEEDANQLDSESFNDNFDMGVIADYVGPAIDEGIVSRINDGLLLSSDRSRTRDQITSNRCAPKQAFATALYISDYLLTINICDSSSDTWPSVKFVIASQMDIVIILTICGSVLEYNKMMPSCSLNFAPGALDSQFSPKADHGSLDLPQAHLIPLPSSPIYAKGGPRVFRPTLLDHT